MIKRGFELVVPVRRKVNLGRLSPSKRKGEGLLRQ